ncbi:hypothetical protein HK097_001177, partial [Rhizophlyctis rosea]
MLASRAATARILKDPERPRKQRKPDTKLTAQRPPQNTSRMSPHLPDELLAEVFTWLQPYTDGPGDAKWREGSAYSLEKWSSTLTTTPQTIHHYPHHTIDFLQPYDSTPQYHCSITAIPLRRGRKKG